MDDMNYRFLVAIIGVLVWVLVELIAAYLKQRAEIKQQRAWLLRDKLFYSMKHE